MSNKHIIEYKGKPAFVVIPFSEYQELINFKKHHITDEELYAEGIAKNEEYFPEELVQRIINGENPIKVYREYREFSQEQLAIKIGKTKQYISAIEKGTRQGTIDTLKNLSTVLNVDLDMLS
ncbi:helix-turn-helix transcriptional regulator [Candidatus Tisiphia endosymbiont of Nemotelus uliginosus]|uniref:helix-turn-helix transcriptional regulator n=1 Tax=Candidatus Tisiphia endosymbiont of Nemotelus uliginosus TaxID=3077926 RepID=UPI0035C933DA